MGEEGGQVVSTTVFDVVDRVTGRVGVMTVNMSKLATETTKAQKAVAGITAAPTTPIAVGTTGNAEIDKRRAERMSEENQVIKEEMLLRRARGRGIRMEMQGERAAHMAATAGLSMLGAESHSLAGAITASLGRYQMVGFMLGQLGGKAGALGGAVASIAGKGVLLGAAFEVAQAAIEKLPIAYEYTRHTLHVYTDEETKLSRELGFRTVEERYAATATNLAARQARIYSLQLGYAAERLGASPLDNVNSSNEEYEEKLEKEIAVYKASHSKLTDEEIAKYGEALREASKHTLQGKEASVKHENAIRESAERYTKSHPIGELGKDPSAAARNNYASAVSAGVYAVMLDTNAKTTEAESIWGVIESLAIHKETLRDAATAARMHAAEEVNMADEGKTLAKQLKILHGHVKPGAAIALENSMIGLALAYSRTQESVNLFPELNATERFDKTLAATKDAYAKRKTQYINNFNNSRFDIKQEFAEGYDAERVAVAFVDELSKAASNRTATGGPSHL